MTYPINRNRGFNFNNFGGTGSFMQLTPEDQEELNNRWPDMRGLGGNPNNPPPTTGEQTLPTMPGMPPDVGPRDWKPTAPVQLPDPVKDEPVQGGINIPTNWGQLYMNEAQNRRDQARLRDQDRARALAMNRVYGGGADFGQGYMTEQPGDAWQQLQGMLQEQQYQQQQEDRRRVIEEAEKPTDDETAPKLRPGYEIDPENARKSFYHIFPDAARELGGYNSEKYNLLLTAYRRMGSAWNSGKLNEVLAEFDLASGGWRPYWAREQRNRDKYIQQVRRYLIKAFNRAKK